MCGGDSHTVPVTGNGALTFERCPTCSGRFWTPFREPVVDTAAFSRADKQLRSWRNWVAMKQPPRSPRP